jgi:hypothetical protein
MRQGKVAAKVAVIVGFAVSVELKNLDAPERNLFSNGSSFY